MKNNEGTYSMNSNPGEDQWGQFDLNQPQNLDNSVETNESLQEKEAERGAKSIETTINSLNAQLEDLERAYTEKKNAGDAEGVREIAEKYQQVYQELALVKDGVGKGGEQAGNREEELRNEVLNKVAGNRGAVKFRTVAVIAGLSAVALTTIVGWFSGLAKPKQEAPQDDTQTQVEAVVDNEDIETAEEGEKVKDFQEYLKADNEEAQARYDRMNALLEGNIWHGEDLPGMWNDQASKSIVMQNTGRHVDNDLMTSQVVYDMICENPSNPTLEEEKMTSLSGALAEPEKALLLLRDRMSLPEFQGMSNEEGVRFLQSIPEGSETKQKYIDKIIEYHENSKVEIKKNIDIENEVLAKIPEEYRPMVKEYLEKHIYVNTKTGRIEAMNLPTSDEALVLVWTYEDENGGVSISMEIKECRNDYIITITPNSWKVTSGGEESTPSGIEENVSGADENPSAGNENPSGANENPSGSNENPSGSNENPSGSNENPSGANENPTGGNENPTGANENPSTGTETAGSEHTPKNPDDLDDPNRKGDGDPIDLDVDVTPPTTEDEDKENIDELKKREEEDKKKKEKEEEIKKQQEEEEKKAKEEAEKKRKEEEERQKKLDEEQRKKEEEEKKKADEAKKKAEEEARKEQEKRAEEERKRKEEEEARKKAEEEAKKREEENKKEAEDNSNKNSDDRKNDWETGNF